MLIIKELTFELLLLNKCMIKNVMIFVVFVSFINTSCGIKENSLENDLIAKDTISIPNIIKSKDIFQLLEKSMEVSVIPLETNRFSAIAKIDKLIAVGDLLYILDKDQHKLFCFDKTGKYMFLIDKKGSGPEEYSEISDFDYYSNKLYLLDKIKFKLLVFNQDGKFNHVINLKRTSSEYDSFGVLNKDNIALIAKGNYSLYIPKVSKEFVHIFDMNGNQKNRMIAKPESYNKRLSRFTIQKGIVRVNKLLYFQLPFDNRIYHINGDACFAKYYMNFSDNHNLDKYIADNNLLNDDEFIQKIENDNTVIPNGVFSFNNKYMIFSADLNKKKVLYMYEYEHKICEMFDLSIFRMFMSGNNEVFLTIESNSLNAIRYSNIQGKAIDKIRKIIDRLNIKIDDNPLLIRLKI